MIIKLVSFLQCRAMRVMWLFCVCVFITGVESHIDVHVVVVDTVLTNFSITPLLWNASVKTLGPDLAIAARQTPGQSEVTIIINSNATHLNLSTNRTWQVLDLKGDTWIDVLGPHSIDVIVEILLAQNITQFSRGDIGLFLSHTRKNMTVLETNETLVAERDKGLVDVGFVFENQGQNISAWKMGAITSVLDHIIYISRISCEIPDWFVNFSGVCSPCSVCAPGQVWVRNCSRIHDRICRSVIQVVAEIPLNVSQDTHVTRFNSSQMQRMLERLFRYSLWDLDQFKRNTSIAVAEDVIATYMTCAPGYFLDLHWECQTCTQCTLNEKEVRVCEARRDRLCSGRTEITVSLADLDWFNASNLYYTWNRSLISESIIVVQNHSLVVRQFDVPDGHFVKYDTPYQYHYEPCTNCTAHETVVRECLLLHNRVCGGKLEIELKFENLTWLNLSTLNLTKLTMTLQGLLEYSMTEKDAISYAVKQTRADTVQVTPIVCHDDMFLVYETTHSWNCTSCQVCEPNTSKQVRQCSILHNRVCERHLDVIVGIESWNLTQVNFSFLEMLLGHLLHYNVHPLDVQVHHRENVTIFPHSIPCPHDNFLLYSTPTNWTCTPCQVCSVDQRIARDCSLLYDRQCRGSIEITVDIQDTLYLDPGLIDVTNMSMILDFLLHKVSVERVRQRENHTVLVNEIICELGKYVNITLAQCVDCTTCTGDTFQTEGCSHRRDTQCQQCTTCKPREYEVCPCGLVSPECPVGDRICYQYPSWNITTWMAFTSNQHSSQLLDYIQLFVWFLKEETRSLSVIIVQHTERSTQMPWILHNITIDLVGVTGMTVTNLNSAPPSLLPLIERASYKADQAFANQNRAPGVVDLVLDVKNTILFNASSLELGLMESLLKTYIPGRDWSLNATILSQLIYEYVVREIITCLPGQYLSTQTWECHNCSSCSITWRNCSLHYDTLCVGMVDVEIYVNNTHDLRTLNLANISRLLERLSGQINLTLNGSKVHDVRQDILLDVVPYPSCIQGTQFLNLTPVRCTNCSGCTGNYKIRLGCEKYRDTICMPKINLEITLQIETDKFIHSKFSYVGFTQKVIDRFNYDILYPGEIHISERENHTISTWFVSCPPHTFYDTFTDGHWICTKCTLCLPWEREIRPCLVSDRLCQGVTDVVVNISGSHSLYEINLTAIGILANQLYNTTHFTNIKTLNSTKTLLHPMVVEPNSIDIELYISDAKRIWSQNWTAWINSSRFQHQSLDVIEAVPNSVDVEFRVNGSIISWDKMAANLSNRVNFTKKSVYNEDSIIVTVKQSEITIWIQDVMNLDFPGFLKQLDSLHPISKQVLSIVNLTTQTVTGFFEKNNTQYPMLFQRFGVDVNHSIQATGHDIGGFFEITGALDVQGTYRMVKTYPGLYSMTYTGTATQKHSDGSFVITGFWDLYGTHQGMFSIVFGREMYSGRRLLALNELVNFTGCPEEFYVHWYDPLGYICIPCNYDPIPTPVNQSMPSFRAYLWYYTVEPCPLPDHARICPGGMKPPECVGRSGLWTVNDTNIIVMSEPTCEPQFSLMITEFLTLCVGITCQQGLTGQPGFCSLCSPGTYKSVLGSTPCTLCNANTFSTAQGASWNSTCTSCKTYSTSDPGSFYEEQCMCKPGYGTDSITNRCTECPLGRYKYFTGNAGCSKCISGTFGSYPGQSLCNACPTGTFTKLLGSSSCQMCEPGTFKAEMRSDRECSECTAGSYASMSGQSGCPLCDINYVSTGKAQLCLKCQEHQYANGTGLSACSWCDPGQGLVDSLYCVPCQGGSYSTSGICTPCWKGTYSTQQGAITDAVCLGCIAGTYTFQEGLTTCSLCPPGRVGLHCIQCDPGTYQPLYGMHTCISCARGEYLSHAGASSFLECLNCERGKFWTGTSSCKDCPTYTTSPPGSLDETECMPEEGFYLGDGRRAQPCPPNHYCTIGISDPVPCPDGLVSEQGSNACSPPIEDVALWNWVVGALWSTIFLLWVGCFWKYKRYWIRLVKRQL